MGRAPANLEAFDLAAVEALDWVFEWVSHDEGRIWIFVVVCIVAVLLGALASLLELGLEFGVSAVVGLLIAAHSGFFLGFSAFTLLFVLLYYWMGRPARVAEPAAGSGES